MGCSQSRYKSQKAPRVVEEASTFFGDPLSLTKKDDRFEEDRNWTIGLSNSRRLIVVAHEDRTDERIRIISARLATRYERRDYEQS